MQKLTAPFTPTQRFTSRLMAIGTIFSLLTVQLFTVQLLTANVALASAGFSVYGTDTVAGYETILKSSKVAPWQTVNFQVTKPDGTSLTFAANSGADGVAKVTLADYHTHKAGQYTLQAEQAVGTFKVYPDKVSSERSVVTIDRTIAQPSLTDAAKVSIQLLDQYGNSVSNHFVQVFSNRAADSIKNPGQTVTDLHGKMQFAVSSNQRGVSDYSVVDTTAGVNLLQKVSVAYVANADLMADVGGFYPFTIDVARAAAGPLNNFKIDGLPDAIQVNQNVNFTVTAQDASNQTVQNYLGKVHFSADGSNGANVVLPEDYTFKAEDLGVHQFSLGLSFKATGGYKIVATDLTNNLIKGTKDVTVGVVGGSSQQVATGNISLDTPISGTYSQKVQTLSGKAQAGYTVKLYDNQQEIGSVQASSEGKYSYQTSLLNEGQHAVYAVMFDVGQVAKGTSNTVLFNIKTSAPQVDEVFLDPNHGIQPNSPINIKIVTENNLTQVAIVLDGNITQLNPGLETAGTYVGTVQAPAIPGIYPMDVLLVDQLGNEGSYKAKTQVTVTNESTQQATQETQQMLATPSKVRGLVAFPGSEKVTLVWDAATDAATTVKHYRVYYGSDARNLDRFVDTWDAATTWYVPNLENGKQLYFAVSAFNTGDLESAELSEVISSTAFDANPELHSAAPENSYQYQGMKRTYPGGPELVWLVLGSGGIGVGLRRLRRKK